MKRSLTLAVTVLLPLNVVAPSIPCAENPAPTVLASEAMAPFLLSSLHVLWGHVTFQRFRRNLTKNVSPLSDPSVSQDVQIEAMEDPAAFADTLQRTYARAVQQSPFDERGFATLPPELRAFNYNPRLSENKTIGPYRAILTLLRGIYKKSGAPTQALPTDLRTLPRATRLFRILLDGHWALVATNQNVQMPVNAMILPDADAVHPQQLTAIAALVPHQLLESPRNGRLRIIFNSYRRGKSWGSIPHLHFQVLEDDPWPIEDLAVLHRATLMGVSISRLRDWPAEFIILKGGTSESRAYLEAELAEFLGTLNITYMVFWAPNGTYFLPRPDSAFRESETLKVPGNIFLAGGRPLLWDREPFDRATSEILDAENRATSISAQDMEGLIEKFQRWHIRTERENIAWKRTRMLFFAGGQSSRLFPVIKQWSDLFNTGRTLLQENVDHILSGPENRRARPDQVYVAVTASQSHIARAQTAGKLPAHNIIVEPHARGSMGSFLFSLARLRHDMERQGLSDIIVETVSADTRTSPGKAFIRSLRRAAAIADARRALVTFGLSPVDDPDLWLTFGVMKRGPLLEDPDVDEHAPVYKIRRFEEKPNHARAVALIHDGDWMWSTGFYVGRLTVFEAAIRAAQPQMWLTYEAISHALERDDIATADTLMAELPSMVEVAGHRRDNTVANALFMPIAASSFAEAPAIVAVPAGFSWKDYGTWESIFNDAPVDMDGNRFLGPPSAIDTIGATNNALGVYGAMRIQAIGVAGLLIIHGADGHAVITTLARSDEVSRLFRTFTGGVERFLRIESENVRALVRDGWVSVLGVRDLEIARFGNLLYVKRLHTSA